MVMAKLLSQEQVGHYVLALAITAPLVLFCSLQLRAVQVADAQNQYQFGDYFGARLTTNFVALLVGIGILLALLGRYSLDICGVIFIVLLNKIIEATSDISYGLFQKHERLDKAALSMIYRNVGGVILLSFVLYFTRELLLGVLAVGLWWLSVLLFFDRNNVEKFARFVPCFHINLLLCIMWLGLPLGVAKGIMTLSANIPRYFIQANLGFADLGLFAAMAYVVVGAIRFVDSLGYSAAARLAKNFISNRKSYVILLAKMVVIAIGMALAAVLFGVFFGKQFLAFVYKQEYAQQPGIFVWLLVVAGLTMVNSMLNFGMIAAKRFKSQVPLNAFTCLVCLSTCYYFIPRYGMNGAVLAMLLTSICKAVGSLIVIALALKTPLNEAGQDVNVLSVKQN